MKVRRLQLEVNQMARLSAKVQLARLSVDFKYRRIKEVRQHRPQMKVRRENPSLKVEMRSLYENIGLKSIRTLAQESVALAQSQVREATKAIENNGDMMAALPRKGGNPVAEIAWRNMLKTRQPIRRGLIDPTVPMKGDPGSFKIDWLIHDLVIKWDDYQSPVITLDPKPSVDVEMVQEPRLEFKVVEQYIPPESGRTIDEKA